MCGSLLWTEFPVYLCASLHPTTTLRPSLWESLAPAKQTLNFNLRSSQTFIIRWKWVALKPDCICLLFIIVMSWGWDGAWLGNGIADGLQVECLFRMCRFWGFTSDSVSLFCSIFSHSPHSCPQGPERRQCSVLKLLSKSPWLQNMPAKGLLITNLPRKSCVSSLLLLVSVAEERKRKMPQFIHLRICLVFCTPDLRRTWSCELGIIISTKKDNLESFLIFLKELQYLEKKINEHLWPE